jgi:photosystem II stability/assembly factor-like uncharacterized protein
MRGQRSAAARLLISALSLTVVIHAGKAATWENLNPGGPALGDALYFLDSRDGWLLDTRRGWLYSNQPAPDGDPVVGHRTSDGGQTWEELRIPGFREPSPTRYFWIAGHGPFSAMRLTREEAWVGGSELVAHTTDAGETWETVHLWPNMAITDGLLRLSSLGVLIVRGLHMDDPSNGVLLIVAESAKDGASRGSMILSTRDGGHTWDDPRMGRGVRIAPGAPRGSLVVYGAGGLYVTDDSGWSWDRVLQDRVAAAYLGVGGAVWAVSEALSYRGPVDVIHSTDMGGSWRPIQVVDSGPGGPEWRGATSALAFAPDARGWAVGTSGVILATEDGETWVHEETPTSARLWDVQYINGAVYATGENGVVLKRKFTPTGVRAARKQVTTWSRVKGDHGSAVR